MNDVWMYLFFIVASILLSSICCYLALKEAHQTKGNKQFNNKKEQFLSAFIYTIFYCLLHASITLILSYQLFFERFLMFVPVFFVVCFICVYVSLSLFQGVNTEKVKFVQGGLIFSSIMVFGNFFTYMGLMYPYLVFKPVYAALTILMTFGATFPYFRMLLQINNQDIPRYGVKHELMWSLIMGLGFVGVTYLTGYSLLSTEQFGSLLNSMEESKLIPYMMELAILLVLWFIPDWLAEEKHQKQIKKILEKEQQYKSLYDNNLSAIYTFNRDGQIVEANQKVTEITGHSVDVILGKSFHDYVWHEDLSSVQGAFEKALLGEALNKDIRIVHQQGHLISVHIIVVPLTLNGTVSGVHVLATDITASIEAEKKIHYLAYHDELTGIPNRRHFKEVFEEEKSRNKGMALLLLDLNRFKIVNDTLGHGYGDELISQVGKRYSDALKEVGFIARMSGDEFIVLLPGFYCRSEIGDVAKRIHEVLETPFQIGGHEIITSTSIGISMYPSDGKDLSTLLKKADIAMYNAKSSAGVHQLQFSDQLEEKGINPIQLEEDLRKALHNKEFELYYQPQVSLKSNEVVGVEALVRWNHPVKGLIPPGDFIPLAEETGLIIPLGEQVLRKACEQLKKWLGQGHELRVSVNVSSRQFHNDEFVGIVKQTIENTNIPPHFLEIEITESTTMHNVHRALKKLNDLRNLGVSIAIDDFGIEYSSLSYLQKYSIQTLKIDRSFIMGIDDNTSNKAIISAILAMAKHLGLSIVAEGVETESQLEWLTSIQCEYVQGYFYSKPVPSDELIEYLLSRNKTVPA
ncbi:putative bifunctional diguanylate cyclase/phosphodiesterase [Rossellomorea aquimaris]|uniref:putative bifunctional diguanylate cyclase/phosphodiesterase n=1 Tax=Rossellomorea aquimaris TaxID=189382 RepID=UPI0007D09207|nr:EAL domain-containing protein [Rossellomorea aquimaris]